MAGNISTYLENKLLAHSVARTSWTMPAAVYGALFTVPPTAAGGGNEVFIQNGYARQALTFGAASGSIATSADVRWPASINASGPWTSISGGTTTQNIVAVGLYDTLTVGNLLWFGPLSASVVIGNGDFFKISAGGLTIALS